MPADSPRYTGFRELVPVDPAVHQRDEDRTPQTLIDDLLSAMARGTPPLSSVASAIDALALGVAVVQAGLTGTVVTPATLDTSLRIASR